MVTITGRVSDTSGAFAATSANATQSTGAPVSTQIGETAQLTVTDSGNGNLLLAQPITLPSSGTLQSLSFLVRVLGGQLRLGLYTDAGALVAQTGAFTPVLGWNTVALTSGTLAAGQYWLAYTPSSSTLGFWHGAGSQIKLVSRTFGAMPATWPTGSTTESNTHFSFYGTFLVDAIVPVPPPTGNDDGSLQAPTGPLNYPGLLNSYVAKPSWKVAGVDYHVGIDRTLYPTNANLKVPSTAALPAGVSRNLTTHDFSITGSNVVFDGWDMSQNGGWSVSVDGGANNIISNCNFVKGANNKVAFGISSSASNVTIKNCSIVGPGTATEMLCYSNGTGTTLLQYNLIDQTLGEGFVFSSNVGGENVVFQYNAISNSGMGFSSGFHGDWIQLYNAPGKNTNNLTCKYNLWLQSIQIAQGRTQGISAFSANSGASSGGCQTENFENNVFIGSLGAYVNFAIIVDTTRLIGSATIRNNYFDLSGIGSANGGGGSAFFIGDYSGGNGGPYHGTVAVSGNVNMKTGGTIT